MGSSQSDTSKSKKAPALAIVARVAIVAAWLLFLPASAQVLVTAKVPGVCGNGLVEIDEQCDGANMGGASCSSLGFGGGTLSCNTDCTFNTEACFPVSPPPPGRSEGGLKFFFFPLPLPLPLPPSLSPDLNRDGRVDVQDLSILLFWLGKTGPDALRYDLNGDGRLDIADISVLFYHWTDRSAP